MTDVGPWHVAHLFVLGLWGGLVAGEFVLELTPKTDDERTLAARVHYWMDLVLELPLLSAVVLTGVVLAVRASPLTSLHWLKIGAGLVAVGVNLWCVVHVVLRHRRTSNVLELRRHGRWVRITAIGVPFGAVALYLGLTYFAR
jgi:hypothetical protein